MGLILDSSVLVAAERQGHNARQMLASLARKVTDTEVGISVITLIELAHGAARADTPERKAKRQKFRTAHGNTDSSCHRASGSTHWASMVPLTRRFCASTVWS